MAGLHPHHLRALHDACKRIGVLDDEAAIAEGTLAAARGAFGAEAVLLLRAPSDGRMRSCDAQELPELEVVAIDASCIVRHGRALTIDDVAPSHVDVYRGYAFAPIQAHDEAIGLLGVRREPEGLTEVDLELLCGLASVAAVAIAQSRAHEDALEQGRRRARLSRYFSPQVATYLAETPDIGQGTTLDATVLMCDIRGFTSFSEAHSPADVFALLNRYFEAMVDAVLVNGGMVDKLIGDAVLAVFGAPLPSDDHALCAVRCAATMVERAGKLALPPPTGDHWAPSQPLRIGVGIASGPLILGDVGGGGVLDFTVIGTTVNLASRVEGATKKLGAPVLLTDETHALLRERVPCDDLGLHALRGIAKPLRLFALTSTLTK